MAKKPRRGGQRSQRQQGHPARNGNVLQFPGRGVAVAQLAALAPAYVAWAAEAGEGDAAEAAEDWKMLVGFAEDYAATHPLRSIDGFDAENVSEILLALAENEAGDYLSFVLDQYLHFLDETGRWSRGPEAYDELHLLIGDPGPNLPGIPDPGLTAAEAWAAWEKTPLVRHAKSLVEWLSAGRDITSTQALRLKDIEGAAAAVGIHARGVRHAKRPPLFDAGGQPMGTTQEPLEVKSMHEVPRLPLYWSALAGGGFIEFGATRARPGTNAAMLASTDPATLAHAALLLAVSFIATLMAEADPGYNDGAAGSSGIFVASVLAAAAGGFSPSADLLNPDLLRDRMRTAIRDPAAAEEDVEMAVASYFASAWLLLAFDAGLLERSGEHLTMPPVAWSAIGGIMEDLFGGNGG